jgi:UDP-N-acetyl-D-glucosamine dehydrogenase
MGTWEMRSKPLPVQTERLRLGDRLPAEGTMPPAELPTETQDTDQTLLHAIQSRRARVTVIGQGYVGLTVAAAAAEVGFSVTGVDVNEARVQSLASAALVVPGVDETLFRAALQSQRLGFTVGYEVSGASDVVLICVPTPVTNGAPDLSYVEAASASLAANLTPGTLVVLESTTYPGTTEEVVCPILERSGLRASGDFYLAYSPERIDPGNLDFGIRNTPRIVAGTTDEALGLAVAFYEQLVDSVVSVSSPRTAELAKLLENTFRHVNIALVNEMAQLCHDMSIDIFEVVDAAATKPFGFMPFYPGPGVGGHCVPLDPTYLAWQVRRDAGRRFGLLEQAQDVNEGMPNYVASRIGEALNELGKPLKGSKILVLGVTYKPDVGDMRESSSLRVMEVLHRRGAQVMFNDPFIDEAQLDGNNVASTTLTDGVVQEADCVVVLTPHSMYDLDAIARLASLVFDARNAYNRPLPVSVVSL